MTTRASSATTTTGPLHFSGRTVVILNAATTLGSTLTELLLSKGAGVVANCPVASAANGRLVNRFTKSTSTTTLFEAAIAEFGGIDILVNLIDLRQDSLLSESTEVGWQSVLGELQAVYKVC